MVFLQEYRNYILNKLKDKSYIDLSPKKSLEEVIKELNVLENNQNELWKHNFC